MCTLSPALDPSIEVYIYLDTGTLCYNLIMYSICYTSTGKFKVAHADTAVQSISGGGETYLLLSSDTDKTLHLEDARMDYGHRLFQAM